MIPDRDEYVKKLRAAIAEYEDRFGEKYPVSDAMIERGPVVYLYEEVQGYLDKGEPYKDSRDVPVKTKTIDGCLRYGSRNDPR